MTVSRENSKCVYEGIKAAGIRSISALPETWLVYLLQLAGSATHKKGHIQHVR